MRSFPLSKKDGVINNSILREAGSIEDFVRGAANTIKDKFELRSKPFETILSTMAPYFFTKSLLGWGLWSLAEMHGIGPGTWIGRWIDKALGFGDPENPPEVKSGDIKNATEGAVDALLKPISGIFAAHHIRLIKEARPGSQRRFSKFLQQVRRGGRMSLVNVLYKFIAAIAIALVGAGVFGGLAGTLGVAPKDKDSEETKAPAAPKKSDTQQYANTQENIERTLIDYMNTAVNKHQGYNFEQAFEIVRKRPLEGSPEMNSVLQQISLMYYNEPIEELNQRKSFYGPKLTSIIYKVMPELKKQVPQKPVSKPSATKSKRDPKKELTQLLKGVF